MGLTSHARRQQIRSLPIVFETQSFAWTSCFCMSQNVNSNTEESISDRADTFMSFSTICKRTSPFGRERYAIVMVLHCHGPFTI